ncbi:MAG: hypothetical protein RL577_1038 [Bacteroidota bacterium]
MARNSIGKNLVLTSFGESHGIGVGAVLDGFPAKFHIDFEALDRQMARRRPGQSELTTSRSESDECQFMSGVFQGQTTGTPLAIFIANEEKKSSDYDHLSDIFRPGHADLTYQAKYGIRDFRGGGRSSARITAAWVAAGSLAMQWLENQGIHVRAWVHQIQHCAMHEINEMPSLSDIESNPVRCPDSKTANNMIHAIEKAKEEGDSLGGIIAFRAEGLPIGVGEPVFGKIQAELGLYLLNINATTGLEFGDGFKASTLRGSEHNDSWIPDEKKLASSHSNHSGGSIGGISTGLPLTGKLAFKPVSSIQKEQKTIDHEGRPVSIQVNGRHDPCVVPRAVPIVESMLALCLMDLVLEYNTYK